MTDLLTGKTALITGAGSGIGQAICLSLAAAGATVAVTVRRIETGEETAGLIRAEGGEAMVVPMDVTNEAAVANGIETVAKKYGELDIVIHNANNAASGLPEPADSVTEETWRRQSIISVGGAFLTAKAAYPWLQKSAQGRFIVMTSNFGYHGAAMNTIYAAQKASFRGLIKSLAREWGADGITVNAISPAAATPPTRTFFDQNPAMEKAYMRKFALGHIGEPRRDIGEAVVALCSNHLQYMTAQTLFLDGGMYPSA